MGGEDSFREFVHARGATLARVAYLLTADRHLAEDLLQSALHKTALRWRHIDEGRREVRLPRARSGTDGPTDVVAVAIDAFDWRVGGSAARVHGFRPLEWLDEAALVLVVVGGVGLFVSPTAEAAHGWGDD